MLNPLTLMLLVWQIKNDTEKLKNDWHMGTHLRVLSWAILWIPIWQGLDGFQKSLRLVLRTKVASALKWINTHSSRKGLTILPKSLRQNHCLKIVEHYQQISFKYFVKPPFIPECLSKVVQGSIEHEWVKVLVWNLTSLFSKQYLTIYIDK